MRKLPKDTKERVEEPSWNRHCQRLMKVELRKLKAMTDDERDLYLKRAREVHP